MKKSLASAAIAAALLTRIHKSPYTAGYSA